MIRRCLVLFGMVFSSSLLLADECRWVPIYYQPIYYQPVWVWPYPSQPIIQVPTKTVTPSKKEEELAPFPKTKLEESVPKSKKEEPTEETPKSKKKPPLIPSGSSEEKSSILELPMTKKEAAKQDKKESNQDFEVYIIRSTPDTKADTKHRVKFFNHSDRDLVLDVNQREVKLASGEYIKLQLPKEFQWSEKGKEPRKQTIPVESIGVDIVIRK